MGVKKGTYEEVCVCNCLALSRRHAGHASRSLLDRIIENKVDPKRAYAALEVEPEPVGVRGVQDLRVPVDDRNLLVLHIANDASVRQDGV